MQDKLSDEYVWSRYPEEYRNQLSEMMFKDKQEFFLVNHYIDDRGDIVFVNDLHANWRELYQRIFSLKPKSIMEIGCGACYHIQNIHQLLPDAELSGVDLLPEQIEFAKTFSRLPQEIWDNIKVTDFTKEIDDTKKYDLLYTQACVMHLSTQHAIDMMRNMEKVAIKNIIMIEGIKNHNEWFALVSDTLPEFSTRITKQYIDYGIILTRK